jgi:hypothetical protein
MGLIFYTVRKKKQLKLHVGKTNWKLLILSTNWFNVKIFAGIKISHRYRKCFSDFNFWEFWKELWDGSEPVLFPTDNSEYSAVSNYARTSSRGK